jgi:hypothetical protein
MNAIEQRFNSTSLTDWQRYDSPTVIRRYGRVFLERCCLTRQQQDLSNSALKTLVESYNGLYRPVHGQFLWVFPDAHWARRCQNPLIQRGVVTLRLGCHLQLSEQD